ncbi:MAG: hypothetical protein AB7T49_20730 [Oligoflexales bacterium]
MNSPVIKDWLELPEKILIPLQVIGNELIGQEPVLQPLAVPCLWDLRNR